MPPTHDGTQPAKVRGLSNFKLKMLSLVLVAVAALGQVIVRRGLPDDLMEASLARFTAYILLESLSWVTLPIYAWLLYSGWSHTHSLRAYGLRLTALAVVTEVPYDLASPGHKVWDLSSQNPVWALVISLIVLFALDRLRKRGGGHGLGLLVVLAAFLWLLLCRVGLRLGLVPAGALILAFALIIFYWHDKENTMVMGGAALGALVGVLPAVGFIFLHFRNDRTGVTTPWGQYGFYIAYPVVLLAAYAAGGPA